MILTSFRFSRLIVDGKFATISPVGPGDAEQTTNTTLAKVSLIAATAGLAYATQANICHRFVYKKKKYINIKVNKFDNKLHFNNKFGFRN